MPISETSASALSTTYTYPKRSSEGTCRPPLNKEAERSSVEKKPSQSTLPTHSLLTLPIEILTTILLKSTLSWKEWVACSMLSKAGREMIFPIILRPALGLTPPKISHDNIPGDGNESVLSQEEIPTANGSPDTTSTRQEEELDGRSHGKSPAASKGSSAHTADQIPSILTLLRSETANAFLRGGKITVPKKGNPSHTYALHKPFEVLVDYALKGRYKSIPSDVIFNAMEFMLSTTNEQENISIQKLIDIGLIERKELCSEANASITAEDPAVIDPLRCLSKEQWGFIRKNMPEILFLNIKKPFDINAFLEIPNDALEGGMKKAFSRADREQVVTLMLKNPTFFTLHKNTLYPEHQHPAISLLRYNFPLENWFKKYIEAGVKIEDNDQNDFRTPFLMAIRNSRSDIVAFFIEIGASLNGRDESGKETPLELAMLMENFEMTRLLLDKGADPLLGSSYENMPLLTARDPEKNYPKDIITAIDNSAQKINRQNKEGYALLHKMVRKDASLEIIQWLLKQGAYPLPRDIYDSNLLTLLPLKTPHATSLQAAIDYGNSPLALSIKETRSKEIIEALINHIENEDITRRDNAGHTLLGNMIRDGASLDTMQYVLDKIENINQEDKNGHTTLYKLIEGGACLETIQYALTKGADPLPKDRAFSETPLGIAATWKKCSPEIIEALLDKSMDKDISQKNTTLFRMIKGRACLQAIQYALAKGADPFPKDRAFSETPLGIAIQEKCSLEIIEALLNKIANKDINQKDNKDRTILCGMIHDRASLEAIQYALAKGADPFPKDRAFSETPLGIAFREKCSLEIIDTLLDKITNKDINQKDNTVHTILYDAINQGKATLEVAQVQLLLKRGADPLLNTGSGSLCSLDFAIKNGHSKEIVNTLIESIKNTNQKAYGVTFEEKIYTILNCAIEHEYDLESIKKIVEKGSLFSFSLSTLFKLRKIKNSAKANQETFEFFKAKASEGLTGFAWLRKVIIFCFCL